MADADRRIEHYAFLQSLMNGARSYGGEATRIYPRLVKHFRDADDKYNSGLSYFTRDMTEIRRGFRFVSQALLKPTSTP